MGYLKGVFIVWLSIYTFATVTDAGKDKGGKVAVSPNGCRHDPIYFATKTAYRWNRNKDDDEIKHDGKFYFESSIARNLFLYYLVRVLKGCKAKQLWILSRHGTRNPGSEDMAELQQVLPELRNLILGNTKAGKGNLCKDDVENLKNWILYANITADKYLRKEGFKELKNLGDRFQERFDKLITRPFKNESYIVR